VPITMEHVRGRTEFRFTKFSGVITDSEIQSYHESLQYFHTLGDVLVDMREADFRKVTSHAIITAGRNLSSPCVLGEARRIAIVVATDEVYGLMRMFQLTAANAPSTVRLFREYADAARWIEMGADQPTEATT
jgi:hypothetical protein